MKRTEIEGFYDPHHVRIGVMYDTDLMPFERALAPGEQFTTADASLIAFKMGRLHDPTGCCLLPPRSSRAPC